MAIKKRIKRIISGVTATVCALTVIAANFSGLVKPISASAATVTMSALCKLRNSAPLWKGANKNDGEEEIQKITLGGELIYCIEPWSTM